MGIYGYGKKNLIRGRLRKKCQRCGKVPMGFAKIGKIEVINRIHKVCLNPSSRHHKKIIYLCTKCREEMIRK